MTARFSSQSFEHLPSPVHQREMASDEFEPGLVALSDCDLATSHLPEESLATDNRADISGEVFVPGHYEPNYAYPLIVWLTAPNAPRGGLRRLMRMISERNYFGVSVEVADPDLIEQQLVETFGRLRRRYRLHTERIYLLGFGDAGTQALATGLCQPAWFAGVAAISARWPETPRLLARYDELRGKHVLLGIEETDGPPVISDALYMQHLLWSAGMHVTALASPAGTEQSRSLLREVDRWIMQAIEQPELVC